jgi:phage replication initiation protein
VLLPYSPGVPPENHSPFVANGVTDVGAVAGSGACARHAAAPSAAPRIVTTGGNSFPPETPETALSSLSHVDWLAFTIKPPIEDDPLGWLFPNLVALFGIPNLTPRKKGGYGYKQSYDMGGLGILAVGGKGQKGTVYVSLNAAGCAQIQDILAVKNWLEAHGARLKRVDLAHDDHDGEILSIEQVVEWYNGDGFSAGGRRPAHEVKGDWLTPGSPKGRTLYVGNRANGKMARIYEKGKQLGDPESHWVRGEVEFKDESRVLPYDMLTRPDIYLAGAYPCFAFLSAVQERIRTITKAAKISLARAVHHAKQATGKLVNVLMQVHGGDAFGVIAELRRDGIPRRLENYDNFLPKVIAGAAP